MVIGRVSLLAAAIFLSYAVANSPAAATSSSGVAAATILPSVTFAFQGADTGGTFEPNGVSRMHATRRDFAPCPPDLLTAVDRPNICSTCCTNRLLELE